MLCANRWLQAHELNLAPDIILEATHISFLEKITFNEIKSYSLEFKKHELNDNKLFKFF